MSGFSGNKRYSPPAFAHDLFVSGPGSLCFFFWATDRGSIAFSKCAALVDGDAISSHASVRYRQGGWVYKTSFVCERKPFIVVSRPPLGGFSTEQQ